MRRDTCRRCMRIAMIGYLSSAVPVFAPTSTTSSSPTTTSTGARSSTCDRRFARYAITMPPCMTSCPRTGVWSDSRAMTIICRSCTEWTVYQNSSTQRLPCTAYQLNHKNIINYIAVILLIYLTLSYHIPVYCQWHCRIRFQSTDWTVYSNSSS